MMSKMYKTESKYKKEATALIEPELSSQGDVSLTASTISISELLD